MAPPPRFASADDIAAFERIPIGERLAGKDLIAMLCDQTERADAPALTYLPGSATDDSMSFTRRQLVEGVAAFAAQLKALGVSSHDVIASLLPNGPGTVAASLAAMAAGRLAPINIYLEPSQIRTLLKECDARVLMVPRELPTAVAGLQSLLQDDDVCRHLSVLTVDTATLPACDERQPASRALFDVVALFHTGGTTGLPKFVPLTAGNLAAGAAISQFAYGYADGDRVLCGMPMFHVGGLFACSLFPLVSDSEVVILGPLGYRGDGIVAALPSLIENLGVSVAVGPPTVMARLAANPPDRDRAGRLRLFVNGAAALPRVVGTRLTEATGVPVVEPWGLTEATLAVTSGPRDGTIRQGSVGLPLPYCEVKAVRTNINGKASGDCAPDEIGVLAVRGPMVFGGYLNRAPDQQPFFADGWLDTGDLGRIDTEGFVWVTGRAKELIKRGGHGIDPGVIEDALSAHPAVALAAAVGKPDVYAGEVPVAYVELRASATATSEDLIAFARECITERAAIPKEIIVLPKLPVTAIGKVHKQTLKLDVTRRAAEECARMVVSADQAIDVRVEAHALHGLEVRLRVPEPCVDTVTEKLSAFAFRSDVSALQQG